LNGNAPEIKCVFSDYTNTLYRKRIHSSPLLTDIRKVYKKCSFDVKNTVISNYVEINE
jgi:hypothetical protein